MRTYLVSYAKRNGDIGLVEMPSTLKLLFWIACRARDCIHIHITVGTNGDYNLMVHGPVQEDDE